MKIHLVTVGTPKLSYAHDGFALYIKRLGFFHQLTVTHLADKWAYDEQKLLAAAGNAYKIALVIDGPQLTSVQFAKKLGDLELRGPICFLIGGPEGLPSSVISQCNEQLGLSKLTFPHDLAMLVFSEALYRASTIKAGQPYHK